MKKAIIIILLTVLTFGSAHSQYRLGFRGSFNISSLSTGSSKSRAGFSAGAMYSKEIADHWYFQPALLYNLEGSKSVSRFKPAYSAYTYNLEVPLIMSRRMGDEDISFGLDFGPFFKYGLHGGYWVDDLTTGERTRPNIFDHKKRFDVGPQVGFSVIVYSLYIGYSFQFGMIRAWDDASNRRGNYYNSCMTFGYLFQMGN
ncbi:outer membrane protein with beta-barrel domain [Dysgonomonas alginatilytica]|uniref:Outer membrane protein with beta-barrel domain n=1 Tax=Dysgonomonas alginatilytica TaxID=1605892 RepID=A0A2V3PTD0_9BACT|nr:outer membrane beta-barrel protein [Dysgonomonas alginatilytica]PXV68960.1 outer membrane protein with beta-barrel domain [Dysgonomonas alginatilytica]